MLAPKSAQQSVHRTAGVCALFLSYGGFPFPSLVLHQPPVTQAANCKDICNRKSATTSVTVLTQKTAITWVTPSGTKARRCSHENRERNSPASRGPASAGLEEE